MAAALPAGQELIPRAEHRVIRGHDATVAGGQRDAAGQLGDIGDLDALGDHRAAPHGCAKQPRRQLRRVGAGRGV